MEPVSDADREQVLTADGLTEAKHYGRLQLRCTLLGMALDLAVLSAVALWLAGPFDEWLAVSVTPNRLLRLGVFFLGLSLAQLLLSFPLSWYSGFSLEHRFELSRQSFARWLGRYLLRNGLAIVFGLVLVVGLYLLIQLADRWWWVAAALATFGVTVVLGQLAPVVILPLFYKIEPLEDSDLADRFRKLAEGTGLRIEGIYRMRLSSETVKANAMLAGLGRTRRVILGDTLLDQFEPGEIEVVLAHEIGHHVYRHITKIVAAGFLAAIATFFIVDLALRWRSQPQPVDYSNLDVAALPIILLVSSVCSMLIGPLQNTASRFFERQCDQYALDQTGAHAEYRSAFTKLAKLNKTDPTPDAWEVVLFHDHPPITERLAMADPPTTS